MPYVAVSPMVRAIGRLMAAHGQAMTLKRTGEVNLAIKGKRLLLRIGDEPVGNAEQTRFRIKVGTAELAASTWAVKTPMPGDLITVDGRDCSVIDVWPLEDGTPVLYELDVVG